MQELEAEAPKILKIRGHRQATQVAERGHGCWVAHAPTVALLEGQFSTSPIRHLDLREQIPYQSQPFSVQSFHNHLDKHSFHFYRVQLRNDLLSLPATLHAESIESTNSLS
jgi:hypothetical protein